ncbi:hypothetical protein PGT21_012963 [Puccinia graminis f. sp. tritici]|uniref:Uncharacterized protein n=1 Tax=Puccinia graminis f. sp. tritici TaxID=56615 RepID=A0A5B0NSJ4_PUCGR|nr:hypothetical protein PGT21_012963 [Puccinia graminis f. sp. tritici]KAA1091883.1 hypothetical protein PGTUg99_015178 [Puccinia graminis f. sp. tritici]
MLDCRMPIYVISTDQSGKLRGDDRNPPIDLEGRPPQGTLKNLGELPPDLDLGGHYRLTGSPPLIYKNASQLYSLLQHQPSNANQPTCFSIIFLCSFFINRAVHILLMLTISSQS